MKPLSDSLRQAIDNLRKTSGDDTEPSWVLELYRDREKMLGLIDPERITSGPDTDIQPATAHASSGIYDVVFERGGSLYGIQSSATNYPEITWGSETLLFTGTAPDVAFDGTFDTTGGFTTSDLLLVYEEPTGTIQFRRRDDSGGTGWQAPVQVGAGSNPSVVRAWADPPEVGDQDNGFAVFYESGTELAYRQSTDGGATWSAETVLDQTNTSASYPSGGTKLSPQAFRLSDYTLGIVFAYDNGTTSDIYFLKTTRTYVNIAAPDETAYVGASGYREYEFVLIEWDYGEQEDGSETTSVGAGNYREADFARNDVDYGQSGDGSETATVGAGGYREADFTGSAP